MARSVGNTNPSSVLARYGKKVGRNRYGERSEGGGNGSRQTCQERKRFPAFMRQQQPNLPDPRFRRGGSGWVDRKKEKREQSTWNYGGTKIQSSRGPRHEWKGEKSKGARGGKKEKHQPFRGKKKGLSELGFGV